MKPLVVVTGAGGLIGQYVVRTVVRWAPDWKVRGLTRRDLELTEFPAVEAMWRTLNPSAVIHCAALSRTKDCEQDPTAARLANVRVTAHLAALACDIPFIFLSSGEVFDGRKGWYDESDEPVPINVYGRTKLEAEQVVLRNPRHSVVRIVLTAGTSVSGDRSFVEDMCRAARAGKDLRLYADEFRCPLPAGVIARALWDLLHAGRPRSLPSRRCGALVTLGDRRAAASPLSGPGWASDPRLRTRSCRGAKARGPVAPLRQDPDALVVSTTRPCTVAEAAGVGRRPMGLSRVMIGRTGDEPPRAIASAEI